MRTWPDRPRPHPTVFERHRPDDAVLDEALAGAEDRCFWLDDVPDAPRFPPLRGDGGRADVAVVGGGFTGLWAAVRAKERDPGARVVLLEARRLGWAASGRNGGFCDASLTHGEENGRSRWPEEYDVLERLGRENLAGLVATVTDRGLAVDLEQTGELSVAVEDHQVDWLREAAAEAAPGSGVRFLDRDEVRREVASPTYLAGLHSPDTALLHPARMVAALARLAADLGVEVAEDSPVTSLTRTRGGPVRVRTGNATVLADGVVLGTNAFPSLVRRFRPFTVPVYDYVLVTEPLDAGQRASLGWQGRQGLADLANQFHYYRLTPDDRILFGGYDAVYRFGGRVRAEHEHRPASHRDLVAHLLTTFPQLTGVRVSHRWAGAIDTSTRFCPFFAPALGGRAVHVAGYTGLGVGSSRFAADTALDLLAGADTERTRLELVRRLPVPFPPEPLAAAGIHLTRWSLDRADHRQGRRNLWLRTLDRLGLGFDS